MVSDLRFITRKSKLSLLPINEILHRSKPEMNLDYLVRFESYVCGYKDAHRVFYL